MSILSFEEVSEFFNFPKLKLHQKTFATTKSRFPLSMGAAGSGKSLAGICRSLFLSIETPYFGKCYPNRGMIGRYSRTDLIPTTMKDFLEMIPEKWIKQYPVKPFYELILINDSEIQFMPVEHLGRFKSTNLGWCFLEEVDEIEMEEHEELAFNRMRRKVLKDGDILPFRSCFAVCNPVPKGHWIYQVWGKNEEFLKSKSLEEQRKFDPEYLVFHSSTYDNEDNLPVDYIKEREKHYGGRNSKRGRIYLMGEWGGIEEQIYWTFTDDLINEEDEWPSLDKPTLVTIDHAWGVNGIVAVDFIAIEEQEVGRTKLLVYDSLTLKDVGIAETVAAIDEALQFHAVMRASKEWYSPTIQRVPIYAAPHDPSMKMQLQRTTDGQEKTSVSEVYQQRAFERGFALPMVAGNNKILAGIDRGQWLMTNKLIRFNPRCSETISALRNYVWDQLKKGEPKAGQDDHHCDGVRYGWMFLNPLHHFPMEVKRRSLMEEIIEKRDRAKIASLREMVL